MISSKTSPQDMNLIRSVLWDRMRNPAQLPVSFRIGGREYFGLPEEFHPTRNSTIIDANITQFVYTATVPLTPLSVRVECLEYKDSAVYEWTVWFENIGNENSPVISDLYGCRLTIPVKNTALLYHNNGDSGKFEGLETETTLLDTPGTLFTASPVNGRSCDGAWPYYRLMSDGFGYNIAIGWPGEWKSHFEREDDGVLFTSRQKHVNFYLKPGEKVRSPRTLLMAFEGDEERGVNVWRRFYFAHVLPKSAGQPIGTNVVFKYTAGGEECTKTTEKNQIAAINEYIRRGEKPDIWWIDAGWYPCVKDGDMHWWYVGSLEPDPERYPNGLDAVGELCEKNGIRFLLWFEPERVTLGCLPEEYPEDYILKLKNPPQEDLAAYGLFYLGNPEGREWLTQKIENLIRKSHIKIYRQDFNNIPFPVDWWLQNDESADRCGITENLHTQGYLQLWDDLLTDIPDLIIDSCASGGRRNDIEAMRRAIPLHSTDFGYGIHPVKQAFHKVWFEWTPYFRSHPYSWDDENGEYRTGKPAAHGFDSYAGHAAFASATSFSAGPYANEEDFQASARFRRLWEKASPYTLHSDFYCLTPTHKSNLDWFAVEFIREEEKKGVLQIMRNTRCEDERLTVFPRGFENGLTYHFDSPEYNRSFDLSGKEINGNGITFTLPKRAGEIWFFSVRSAKQ